jgi:hypothetical protein
VGRLPRLLAWPPFVSVATRSSGWPCCRSSAARCSCCSAGSPTSTSGTRSPSSSPRLLDGVDHDRRADRPHRRQGHDPPALTPYPPRRTGSGHAAVDPEPGDAS